MSLLRRIFQRRRQADTPRGSFVMDAEWERSEELRVDRLGPSQDDVVNPEKIRIEKWRPSRTLGPLP